MTFFRRAGLIFASILIVVMTAIFRANAQHLSESFEGDNGKITLKLDRVYPLQENLFLLPQITSASFNDELELALALKQSPGIVLYDSNGKQTKQVGSIGKGPGEYITASALQLVKDTLYLWDSNQLKFLKYDASKNAPLLEIKDFRWAVQDFAVVDDQIYFYNSGKTSGPYIEQYKIKKNEYGKRYGDRTEAHNLLGSYRYAGGIGKRDDFIFFISPSSLTINRINTVNQTTKSFEIKDPDFQVTEIENAREIMLDRKKLSRIAGGTSRIINLLAMDEFVIIVAKIGEGKYLEEIGGYSAENRKIRFYVLDTDMNLIDTITFSVFAKPDIQGGNLWGANNNQLFYLSTYNLFGEESPNDPDTPLYYMHIWDLEEIHK